MSDNKRLFQLFAVLIYDSDTKITQGTSYLTSGQRICINQERAFLMADFPTKDSFNQSQDINDKVNFILHQIRINKLSNAYLSHVREQLTF